MLHVTTGAVTVRMRLPAAAGLRDALIAALDKIAADDRTTTAPRAASIGDDLLS